MSKKKCPEFENHERWLVSYADMLTLLFAVFVVLFALKDDGSKASQDAAGSLQESFNKPLQEIPPGHRIGPNEMGIGVFEGMGGYLTEPPDHVGIPSNEVPIKVIEDEMDAMKSKLEERLYGPKDNPDKPDPGFERIVSVLRTRKGFKLRLLARHFYEPGRVEVSPQAKEKLDVIVQSLKELGRNVTVEGHTDSSAARGKLTNWDLSALRATRILQSMIVDHHFPATRLTAAGLGASRPMASNSTENGRRLNRRIEFHIEYDNDMDRDP